MESDEQRLRKVSIGFGMMVASVVVLFLYVVSFIVSPLTASIGNADFTRAVIMIQLRFALPIMFTSTLLGIAGPSLCLAAPRDVKGTGYLLISIGLNAINLLVIALARFSIVPMWLSGIALFLPYVSILVFVLFVRRIAIYLERQEIRQLADDSLIFTGIAAVMFAIPLVMVSFHANPIRNDLGAEVGVVILVITIGWPVAILISTVLAFLRYLRMLECARRATFAGRQPPSCSEDSSKQVRSTAVSSQVPVAIGLGMMFASAVVLFPFVVFVIVSPLVASLESPPVTSVMNMFALPIMMTSTLLGIVGSCLCLAAPYDNKGGNYLLITIGFNAINLLLTALGVLDILQEWARNLPWFLPCVSTSAFILFFSRLAINLQRPDIRQLARGTLILAGVVSVLAAIPRLLVKLNIDLGPDHLGTQAGYVDGIFVHGRSGVILVCIILAFLRYCMMLGKARSATWAWRMSGSPIDSQWSRLRMIHILRSVGLILVILMGLMVAVSDQSPVTLPSVPVSKQAAPPNLFTPVPVSNAPVSNAPVSNASVSNASVPRPGDLGFEVKKFPIELAVIPAVHTDLGITAEQAQRLQALSTEYTTEKDNQSEDEQAAAAKLAEWNDECKAKLSNLLSADQWDRLGQIAFQTIGERFVTDPEISAKLQFSGDQQKKFRSIRAEHRLKRPTLHLSREFALSMEQDLIAVLTPEQQQLLAEMKGRTFAGIWPLTIPVILSKEARAPGVLIELSTNPVAQDDLKVTEEQIAKLAELKREYASGLFNASNLIGAAKEKRRIEIADKYTLKLAEVISESQVERLGQIALQLLGSHAYLQPDVKANLNLTQEQQARMESVNREYFPKRTEVFRNGPRPTMQARLRDLEHALDNDLRAVLTADQQQKMSEMKGKEFVGILASSHAALGTMPSIATAPAPVSQVIEALFAGNKPFDFDFDLMDIEGQAIAKSDFAGKVLIVDVWGTWCPPCRREIPHFVALQKEFGDAGLVIVGLNQENVSEEDAGKLVREFHEKNEMNYRCALVNQALLQTIPEFRGFPTTLFIDRSGKVRLKVVGYHDYDWLEVIVQKLLDEKT